MYPLREIALQHATTRAFKARLREAQEIVQRALDTVGREGWYVAFSGGKDSTVVADIVRQFVPDIPLVWSDDEWYLPETAAYMERMKQRGVDLRHIRVSVAHTPWFRVEGEWDGIGEYVQAQRWVGAFLGLRQEESAARRVYLRTYGPLHYVRKRAQWQCNPIHQWTWRDVWAYIHSRGLDYNRAYDRLSEIGVPPHEQRIGPLAVERMLGRGQLAILKRGWPDLFNRFAAEHPEARLYV